MSQARLIRTRPAEAQISPRSEKLSGGGKSHDRQFSTARPGTASESLSAETTVQSRSEGAIAAIIMSTRGPAWLVACHRLLGARNALYHDRGLALVGEVGPTRLADRDLKDLADGNSLKSPGLTLRPSAQSADCLFPAQHSSAIGGVDPEKISRRFSKLGAPRLSSSPIS